MKRSLILAMTCILALWCASLTYAKTISEVPVFPHDQEIDGYNVPVVNWYYVLLAKWFSFLSPSMDAAQALEKAELWTPVFASALGVILMALIAILSGFYRLKPEQLSDEQILPPKRFGLFAFIEICWSIVHSTLESTLGEKCWNRYITVLGGTFFLLAIINLSGVIPGLHPATSSMGFTFAAAIFIFFYFNYHGLKEAGFDYIKHLAGPILWMAPIIFVIELVSLLARPVSLSLRIFGNINGDHFVFSIFSGLMKAIHLPFLPIPSTFVAIVQAFIFMTLSAVYIKMGLDSKSHH
jgi:F-type H+-transporting ATPase subunit a